MTRQHQHAHAPGHPAAPGTPPLSPTAHWEQRYAESDRVWSGKVNATTASVVAAFTPGEAIDLGCGEGGDVLWLAEHGWTAQGLDISPTAVGRARAEAEARRLATATFAATDLEAWEPEPSSADLVTASFFQSDVALERTAILRRAATVLRPGGHLVLVSHAAPPSWASDHPARMIGSREEVEQLALPAAEWEVVTCEDRPRPAVGPDGAPGEHLDAVVVLRRR
ncbi:class I SAM-dependent methyltransferase [Brachybacterium sp. J153]|uniref:class I SAM-dependent methyltransferase n=1 Tax=Brachybacterium sp. J153 TaxID=3116488 RepID=UPI002E773C37|nr:class I SAM-dependent methyltransferase [Brachybacterium sp. J153]MEE1618654.1 class I SAM-dependent methyltransferase [Brachybacterium sp. J153]